MFFKKRFGTWNDLLIDLLNEKVSNLEAAKKQNEIRDKTKNLKSFILLDEKVFEIKKLPSIIT